MEMAVLAQRFPNLPAEVLHTVLIVYNFDVDAATEHIRTECALAEAKGETIGANEEWETVDLHGVNEPEAVNPPEPEEEPVLIEDIPEEEAQQPNAPSNNGNFEGFLQEVADTVSDAATNFVPEVERAVQDVCEDLKAENVTNAVGEIVEDVKAAEPDIERAVDNVCEDLKPQNVTAAAKKVKAQIKTGVEGVTGFATGAPSQPEGSAAEEAPEVQSNEPQPNAEPAQAGPSNPLQYVFELPIHDTAMNAGKAVAGGVAYAGKRVYTGSQVAFNATVCGVSAFVGGIKAGINEAMESNQENTAEKES